METASPSDLFADPAGLLHDLLAVSLTAVNLLRPLYGPEGAELVDFAVEYLNPAAQRITGLPERPNISTRTRFPDIFTNGVFDFYRRVYTTGEPGRYDFHYQADGFDNYFHVAARRSGDRLLVSFTDTADHDRTPVEMALRESQARERDARAEADAQRQRLHEVLMALPAPVATFCGPAHVYELVNPRYQQLFPTRPVLGLPIRQALPELASKGIFERLDQVYQTGEPLFDPEQEAWVDLTGTGRLEKRYFNVMFQALHSRPGRVEGILNFAYDITEQVESRQQVEMLNQELETRVAERTAQVQAAAAHQAQERETFDQVFAQAPICVLRGAEHRFEYFNAAYQQLFSGRELAGCTVAEALPEAVEQGFVALLDRVYQTGEPFSGIEIPLTLTPADGQPSRTDYYTFIYQAYRENGQVAGISVFGENMTGQVLARQEHERQQRHLADLFEQAPAALAVFRGPRYVIELANPAVCAMWGRTPQQTIGTPLFELLPEAAGQGFEELLDQVMATGVPYVAHELPSIIDREGRRDTVYWNFVYQPLREGDDRITAVTVVATDVTEQVLARQQAEALYAERLALAQRQAQERQEFYEIFEQTPAAIVVLRGSEHRYEYFNAAYLTLFPGRDLLGRSVAEALPEAEAQGFVALLDHVYQTGETYYGTELPLTTAQPNGAPPRETFFNLTYQALRENGAVTGISVFAYDVTEQVLARQERERQRRHLEELFEQAPVAFAVFRGPRHVVELANDAACAMWGRPPAQVLHRSILDVLPELAGQGIRELLDGVTTTGAPYVNPELRVELDRHGRRDTVYFNLIYHPLREADGRITGLTVIAADVSEQVRARHQVQALNEELAVTNQALQASNADLAATNRQLTRTNVDLDTFIYTASHDLKQPIANIEGLLDALREHLPPAVHQEPLVPRLLGLMQDDVERFQRTINQLTNLTRLQAAHDAPAEAVDMAAVVEAVRLDVAPQLAGVQLTVDIPADLRVHFSPRNLRSVVYNLLSNAIKYRHPDRPAVVSLRAYTTGQMTVLEVQDNGLGLDAAQQSQLFGLFQRLHTHVEGTGMGLYIIKRMVENASGTIAVHSQAGVGSTFTVTFPA